MVGVLCVCVRYQFLLRNAGNYCYFFLSNQSKIMKSQQTAPEVPEGKK